MDNDHNCRLGVLSKHHDKLRYHPDNGRNNHNNKQHCNHKFNYCALHQHFIRQLYNNTDRYRQHFADIHHEHLDQDNNNNKYHNHNIDKHISYDHDLNNSNHNDIDFNLDDNLFINDNHNDNHEHDLYLHKLLTDYHRLHNSQYDINLSDNDNDNHDLNHSADITSAHGYYDHDDSDGDDYSGCEGMHNCVRCIWFGVGS